MAAPSKRILLILGQVWPEPSTTAAGERMMQLIRSFQEANYDIHFASSASQTDHSEDLSDLGIKTLKIGINDSDFDMMIGELQPDIVMFDRFVVEEQFGWRVAEYSPRSLRILNTEDLHSLRKARGEALNTSKECTPSYWLEQSDTLRELASILRCDLSLLISEIELNWLSNTGIIPDNLLFYLPFMLNNINNYHTEDYINFNERIDFIFAGHGKHRPNEDAVQFLKADIWPLIRKKLPDANLKVFGDGYSTKMQRLHDPDTGFFMSGWVDDLHAEITKARINLATLRFGAGLKGKVVRAIAAGTPSMMTSIAAEGILPAKGYEECRADEPAEIVTKAVELYSNKTSWETVQAALIERYNAIFDREHHHSMLHRQMEILFDTVENVRANNIVGRMLRHQSLNSQKYMAKWIEAKNKIQ
ncbi:MAG: glycosyltransferase family 4 protein [Bacteroidia bacterium]|nr:glycosyltransferase family 4 protein [Bacteroidia bacterium]